MSKIQVTWAELRRGSDTLLIPYMAWFSVFTEASARAPEPATWDEAAGTWQVSEASAVVFASTLARRSPIEFEQAVGRADLGVGLSATVALEGLVAGAGAQAKEDAERFLRAGPFAWRFVSI